MNNSKHENYEILNLIGYGLAKFSEKFVEAFGYKTKSGLTNYLIERGVAQTRGTIKNRQDLFDNFFDNGRKGWWQKGDTYIHRKILLDSLFGDLDAVAFAEVVKMHLEENFGVVKSTQIKPIVRSKFKQLQTTGFAAETYFMSNFAQIEAFAGGTLEDARLFGDGYDFQVKTSGHYYLADVKGLQDVYGGVRLTNNEYNQALDYGNDYCLVVVSGLMTTPKMTPIFDPISHLALTKQFIESKQIQYSSKALNW